MSSHANSRPAMSTYFLNIALIGLTSLTISFGLENCDYEYFEKASVCRLEGDLIPYSAEVETLIKLKAIQQVDVHTHSIRLYIELTSYWYDASIGTSDGNTETLLIINAEDSKEIWHPSLMFNNLIKYEKTLNYGTSGHASIFLYYIGSLEYSESAIYEVSCDFEFHDFPFDSHLCRLIYEPDLNDLAAPTLLPSFIEYGNFGAYKGEKIEITNTSYPYIFEVRSLTEKDPIHNRTKTGIEVRLTRNSFGLLATGYYLPTTIFALVSMISFLVNPEVVPGRMGLIVTLYLISANVYNSVKAPESRGFSYIEVWMMGMQLPILLAIIEYGVVLFLLKSKPEVKPSMTGKDLDEKDKLNARLKKMDYGTMLFSFIWIILFIIIYWGALA